MPRSVPGEGAPILLFLMGDSEHSGAGNIQGPMKDGHHSVMSVHVGEDYSTCEWPVVVKVQRGFAPEFLADRLEDLVASLREKGFGFWGDVPDELPDYVLRAADEDRRRLRIGKKEAPLRVVIEKPDAPDVEYQISVVRSEQEEPEQVPAADAPQEGDEE